MTIPKIYFDEAGNTGSNLLDPEQPFFVLASVNFSDSEINELFDIFETNSQELHFVKVKKHTKGQNNIITFLNHDLINPSKVKFSFGDKKFEAIAQMADLLVEPVLYDIGVDFYKYGLNLAYSNMLYISGTCFSDKIDFEEVVSDFVKMIRTKSKDSVENFYESLFILNETCRPELQQLLSPILPSRNQIDSIFEGINKYSIDPCYPAFNVLCDSWFRELKCDFDILHDNSKQIEFWGEMINFMADKTKIPEVEVGYGSRTSNYPLRINNLSLIDSKMQKGAQIADIIASCLAYVAKEDRNGSNDDFIIKAKESKLFNMHHHAIIPSTKVTPEQLDMEKEGGTNPLDFLAMIGMKYEAEFQKISPKSK